MSQQHSRVVAQGVSAIRFTAILIAVCASVGLGSASATPRAPSAASGAPVFSGNAGARTLPTITVRVPSTLRWTSSGPAFLLITDTSLGGSVSSQAASGATYLKPGAYNLTLKAWAAGTIRIVADVERPRPLGGGLVGFRGNGSRELPPFTTQRSTNLIWTNTGGLFSIDSGLWTLRVSSQAKRGKRVMGRGVHTFVVNANGTWTVGWRP
jgi:hypothetical protein